MDDPVIPPAKPRQLVSPEFPTTNLLNFPEYSASRKENGSPASVRKESR